MTYLQIVNRVLRRLRESPVSSISQNDYSALIGELVNEAKEEVENAWDWVRLRNTVQFSTEADVYKYTLSGAGERFRILSVFNDTEDYEIVRAPSQIWMNRAFNTGTSQSGQPMYYDFNGYSGDDPQVDLWPIPSSVGTLNFNMLVPQAEMTEEADVLIIPSRPVRLKAYALAISERGEDGGQSYSEVDEQYQKALHDAVAIDASNVPNETIWYY